ncbi:putative restriction/modification enzyme [Natrinema pallidum DSM 3751]|uniref:site-specific DNA-methyltransferase (adenine-specific) n=1 Tax=Natrinema pallidum DSM 3751 TaxID=1227495 RepID=L9YXN0_9EURY|nr:N-6 DNA methylase [Natrinema pallidum]ELY78237.1 putative restriction/modification enzyme [Natrinema pallidum DSM 3751]
MHFTNYETNESQLENEFIRPLFDILGIPYVVEESANQTRRRPDYGFFASDEAISKAFEHREEGGDFYKNAIAVADAKRWGRALDTRGKKQRDFENPSHQIDQYLRFTSTTWGVLTNGKRWRLYYRPTSHKLDSYYEVDLPTILESGDLEDFKSFYLFFRHEAFLKDASGDCFLDDVYDESNVFAQELGEDLQDNIYEAIKVLSEGFLQYSENDLKEDDLELIHDSSLIYLYRLIFVLYAEAEGRDLLDTDNEIYENEYSLNAIKQEVADELDSAEPKYRDWQDKLSSRLEGLFTLIDQGSKSRNIPEDDLYIPAYNGGLFRTDPDPDDSPEARFLAEHKVGDAHLAKVIDLLTRSEQGNGGGKIFVDYSSLDVRHLGSIYEGLLEYQLNIADEPLALEDGEYVIPGEGDDIVVEEGEVYLTTDSGERKATGSYYTPEYVVEYIVENTLKPLVEDIRMDLAGQSAYDEGGFAEEFAERVFELKILDPAMGSGHFLTSTIDYLAREIIDAQEKQAAQQGIEMVDKEHDINWARRQVAQRCIYGVDLNPLAVELAKVSLWLRTLAAEQPLAFLDHHLKTGNSLIGDDIEDVLSQDSNCATESGQLTLQQSFAHTRQRALEHVMQRFTDLLSIDNETLADIKKMEDVYDEVRDDPLYQHLLAMANVYTAEEFGLDVPGDAYERMAEALRDDSWEDVEGQDWFRSAQAMADDDDFFHWELEFPVAFYDQDGERKDNAGFDAVVGNPPWIDIKGLDNPETLFDLFETSFNRVNIYAAFCERSTSLTKISGKFGFVVPNSYMTQSSYEPLREHILHNHELNSIVRLPDGVFDGVTMETSILVAERHDLPKIPNYSFPVILYDPGETAQSIPDKHAVTKTVSTSYWDHGSLVFDIFTSEEEREVLKAIEESKPTINDYFETCLGLTPYDKHEGHTKKQIENRVFHSDQKESDDYYKITTGEGIHRFWASWEGGEWIEYGDWLGAEREKRFFTEPRCIVRQIVSTDGRYGINAAYSDKTLFHTQVGFVLFPQDREPQKARCITGILNSSLLTFYHRKKYLDENKETFQKILIQDCKEFPLPSDLVSEELTKKVSQRAELGRKRAELNLSLLNYLGNYTEGSRLPDIGLFQPTSSNILDASTEEYERLRIGDVRTERNRSRVTVYATARYKPENEDEFETDQWGYTETDYREAFTLTDLTEEEATLVEEFVPVAVEEADGFAGFRDNATKTNSPIDRLKAITLPDLDGIADDLQRYIEVKERAEELDEKIEKTDRLIDQIVYDLYGLTDEKIEIVESAVQND